MDFSVSELIKQNTPGNSEGFPAGVPPSYNWYQGWNDGGLWSPPADFTAVEGWGQVYSKVGEPPYSNPDATVEVANAKTYVRIKQAGEWTLVQDQARTQLTGGHFVPDFVGNVAIPMKATPLAGATVAFDAPPAGYNNHFWYKARGTYPAGVVDAVYVQMEMRVTDPNLRLVAMVGADWWRDARAPYLDDHSNNPGVGGSNWIELSTQWKTIGFYSMSADGFFASPAPPLRGLAKETLPPRPQTPTRSGENFIQDGPAQLAPLSSKQKHTTADGTDGPAKAQENGQQSMNSSSRIIPAGPVTAIHAPSNDCLLTFALTLGALAKVRWTKPAKPRSNEADVRA
ncbi:hypothetical protein M2189_008747 [Bradyrhizobium japonicum]|uniref:hypothetical protein n=1 Tax=Bradyrhizobium japonicum TaxID=375 RepID=UPI0021699D2A|nr:hypothetical protein [Bradyrhizobium japonicum]MCS3501742.1 hypothetical protein [Bradyrhizobium japonicum]MCS3965544.1 hypothetical protein [Bradyrhizobium japonicum]MCS3997851.1 hypothetical protein [Bradyrhizobium japonicum]